MTLEKMVDSKLLSLRNRKNTAVKVLLFTAVAAGLGFVVGTLFGGSIF